MGQTEAKAVLFERRSAEKRRLQPGITHFQSVSNVRLA